MAKDTVLELCLRLNAAVAKRLNSNARKCGLTRSAYLRRLIMETPVKECQAQEIRDLYAEINRIGNNVNQIARSVNMGIATPETAEQSLFLLQRIYNLMYALANK